MGGIYAEDPQGWKRPWGLWGVGLRLKEQKGPRHASHPWSQRAGTSPGSPAGFLGSSGWGRYPPLLSWSSGLGGPLLPASPDLLGLTPMPPGPVKLGEGGGLGGQGTSLGVQQAPQPEWARRLPSTPLPLFPECPSRLPLLISPASGAPILSGLHFSAPLSPPTSYWFTFGVPPIFLGVSVPHQRLAGTRVVGRR